MLIIQEFIKEFSDSHTLLATAIQKIVKVVEKAPKEFLERNDEARKVHEAARLVLGMKEQQAEQHGERDEENIWDQSQHPFWTCQELQETMLKLERAHDMKNRFKDFPSFSLGLTQESEERRTTAAQRCWEGINKVAEEINNNIMLEVV